jgi:hypothetical protein
MHTATGERKANAMSIGAMVVAATQMVTMAKR